VGCAYAASLKTNIHFNPPSPPRRFFFALGGTLEPEISYLLSILEPGH